MYFSVNHMKSVCFIIEDSNFNHWFKWCLVGFSKVTIFPFIVNNYLWGHTLDLCKYCSSTSVHSVSFLSFLQ